MDEQIRFASVYFKIIFHASMFLKNACHYLVRINVLLCVIQGLSPFFSEILNRICGTFLPGLVETQEDGDK